MSTIFEIEQQIAALKIKLVKQEKYLEQCIDVGDSRSITNIQDMIDRTTNEIELKTNEISLMQAELGLE